MRRSRVSRLRAAALVVLLVLTGGVACDTVFTPSTPGSGMPEIDAIFADYDRSDSPGCALGMIQDGEVVYRRGYGMADLEHGFALGSDSVFRIGSVSKQFTAMVILLLEEQGRLSRDDDIRRWLPVMPDLGEPITVRHLLHHTSGLRDYLELMTLAGFRDEDYYTASDLLEFLTRQRDLNSLPGREHRYSNSGYFLLGQIVESATGQGLAEVAQELIFEPLGMLDTHFHDDITRIVPRRAMGYALAQEDGLEISMTTLPIIGDGGVFTSVDDLVAWEHNFYDNQLGDGGAELIERWLEPGVLVNGEPVKYSAGIVDQTYRGVRMVGHGGAFVGFRASMLTFPEQRFSVITLCNLGDAAAGSLARRVADVHLGDILQAAEAEEPLVSRTDTDSTQEFLLPVAELRDYTGRYVSSELGVRYALAIDDGRLTLAIPHMDPEVLLAAAEDRFGTDPSWLQVHFGRDSRGRVNGFLLDTDRVRNLWFARLE